VPFRMIRNDITKVKADARSWQAGQCATNAKNREFPSGRRFSVFACVHPRCCFEASIPLTLQISYLNRLKKML
jgi:hypothetical protein